MGLNAAFERRGALTRFPLLKPKLRRAQARCSVHGPVRREDVVALSTQFPIAENFRWHRRARTTGVQPPLVVLVLSSPCQSPLSRYRGKGRQ